MRKRRMFNINAGIFAALVISDAAAIAAKYNDRTIKIDQTSTTGVCVSTDNYHVASSLASDLVLGDYEFTFTIVDI